MKYIKTYENLNYSQFEEILKMFNVIDIFFDERYGLNDIYVEEYVFNNGDIDLEIKTNNKKIVGEYNVDKLSDSEFMFLYNELRNTNIIEQIKEIFTPEEIQNYIIKKKAKKYNV